MSSRKKECNARRSNFDKLAKGNLCLTRITTTPSRTQKRFLRHGLVGLATSLVLAPQERSIEDTMFISERRTNDDEGEAAVGGVGVVGL